jgi:hypothetical protein
MRAVARLEKKNNNPIDTLDGENRRWEKILFNELRA